MGFPFSGRGFAIMEAREGSRSMVVTSSSETVPAGMRSGPQIIHGTRWPPSNGVPFPARRGSAFPP